MNSARTAHRHLLPAWLLVPALVLLCTGCAGTSASARAQGEPVRLTILHTGNLAGRVDLLSGVPGVRDRVQREVGRVLLVDTGGAMLRSESSFEHADGTESLTVSVFNALRYDAWALGARELSRPEAELSAALREARFPVLGANLHQADTGRPLFQVQPYVVVPIAGLRVGLLGLGTGGTAAAVTEPARAASYFVPQLRARCDLVCVLSGLGFQADSLLAAGTSGIDLIVGTRRDSALSVPVRIDETVVAATGGPQPALGRVDLTLGEGHAVVSEGGGQIVLAGGADAQGLLAGWSATVDGETEPLTAVLGTVGEGLGQGAASGPALGNLVADLIREAASAEIGFVAATSLNPTIAPGPVRVLDLYRAYEWPLHLEVLTAKGKQIRAFLEGTLDTPPIAFYPSGLEVVYDFSRSEGDRVVMAKVGPALLNDDRVYRVVVEDGVVGDAGVGPGLGELLEAASRTQAGVAVRDLIARHIRDGGRLEGRADGRVQQR